MSTQGLRQYLEGNFRDVQIRIVGFDLNHPPPDENMVHGTFTSGNPQVVQAGVHGQTQLQSANPIEIIDDDIAISTSPTWTIDDDIAVISPRRFAEAKKNSRRYHEMMEVHDAVREVNNGLSEFAVHQFPLCCHKPRCTPQNQTVMNWELSLNLELGINAKTKNVPLLPEPPQTVPPPEPPKSKCPICIEPFSQETTTKCGHIFCKKCIEAAIAAQGRCPTCRKKLKMKDTIRIYLPS